MYSFPTSFCLVAASKLPEDAGSSGSGMGYVGEILFTHACIYMYMYMFGNDSKPPAHFRVL